MIHKALISYVSEPDGCVCEFTSLSQDVPYKKKLNIAEYQIHRWLSGEHIQDAMSNLSADDRELFVVGHYDDDYLKIDTEIEHTNLLVNNKQPYNSLATLLNTDIRKLDKVANACKIWASAYPDEVAYDERKHRAVFYTYEHCVEIRYRQNIPSDYQYQILIFNDSTRKCLYNSGGLANMNIVIGLLKEILPYQIKDNRNYFGYTEQQLPTLDLNTSLDVENVSAWISKIDDSEFRQIRVTKSRIAIISSENTEGIGNQNAEHYLFCLETFCEGNGYTGKDAGEDRRWTEELTSTLVRYLANPYLCDGEK